jgi:hypothetical protein
MVFLTSQGKNSKEYLKLHNVLTNLSYHVTLNNLISCKNVKYTELN